MEEVNDLGLNGLNVVNSLWVDTMIFLSLFHIPYISSLFIFFTLWKFYHLLTSFMMSCILLLCLLYFCFVLIIWHPGSSSVLLWVSSSCCLVKWKKHAWLYINSMLTHNKTLLLRVCIYCSICQQQQCYTQHQFRVSFFVCLSVCQASQPASQIYDHFHILAQTLQYKGWRCLRDVEPDSALICYMFLSDAAMYQVCKSWGFHNSVFDYSSLLWCDTVSYWTTWQRRQCHSPEDLNPILNMDACDSNVEQINSDTHYMIQRHNDSACLWQCWNLENCM